MLAIFMFVDAGGRVTHVGNFPMEQGTCAVPLY